MNETGVETMENTAKQIMVRESQDIFQRFDELDDQVIVAEIENRIVEEWVYHFTEGNKDVWGIGKAGIDGCVSELGKKGIALREEGITYSLDPTNAQYVLFTATVSKHFIGKDGGEAAVERMIGTKRQWTKIKKTDGSIAENKFWFEQGSIKALRNAKSRLIPEDIKAKIIAFAKEKGKVKIVSSVNESAPERDASKPDALENGNMITQEQMSSLVDLMDELKHLGEGQDKIWNTICKKTKENYNVIPADLNDLTQEQAGRIITYLAGWKRKAEQRQTKEEYA